MAEFSVQLRKIFPFLHKFFDYIIILTPIHQSTPKLNQLGVITAIALCWSHFYNILGPLFFTIFLDRLLQYFERMKDLEKKESLEAINARLQREYERLQADYLATCAINEMWRQKVREMEKRKSELLRQRAEREKEECILQKATDNSQ